MILIHVSLICFLLLFLIGSCVAVTAAMWWMAFNTAKEVGLLEPIQAEPEPVKIYMPSKPRFDISARIASS